MSADTFRKLAALGLTTEQIAGVFDIIDAREKVYIEADEARKANARARVQKWRENHSVTLQEHNGNERKRLTRGEDNLQTKKISGKEERKETSPAARPSKGTRIPDDFKPDIEAAVADGLPRIEATRQASSFTDYWRAKPGKDGLKLDWDATWRVWYRRHLSARSPPIPLASSPTRTMNDVLNEIQGKTDVSHAGPTIDASFERADRGGSANLVQLHAAAPRFRS